MASVQKKDFIVEKLDALIERLKRESGILNITDTAAYQKMKLENAIWLEVESVYQLSLEKTHQDEGAESFAEQQLEVKNRIEHLTQKDLKTIIQEYPGKKDEVNGEREVVLELIDMVEGIDENNLMDRSRRQSLSSALHRSSALLSQITHAHAHAHARHDNWAQSAVKAQAALRLLSTRLRQQVQGGVGRGRMTGLAVTAHDIESTKSSVLKILYELLKEPDFRAHLLKQGVEAAEKALKEAQEAKEAAEAKVANDGQHTDKNQFTGQEEGLGRQKAKGVAFESTEEFKAEHAAFLEQYGPVMREIYILTTLKDKIVEYCVTGVWKKGGFDFESNSFKAQEARNKILKEMRDGPNGLLKSVMSSGGGL